MLRDGIAQYIAQQPNSPSKPTMWTMIFLSKERLEAVLARTVWQFRDGQASCSDHFPTRIPALLNSLNYL
jgi:hypothetical protein